MQPISNVSRLHLSPKLDDDQYAGGLYTHIEIIYLVDLISQTQLPTNYIVEPRPRPCSSCSLVLDPRTRRACRGDWCSVQHCGRCELRARFKIEYSFSRELLKHRLRNCSELMITLPCQWTMTCWKITMGIIRLVVGVDVLRFSKHFL